MRAALATVFLLTTLAGAVRAQPIPPGYAAEPVPYDVPYVPYTPPPAQAQNTAAAPPVEMHGPAPDLPDDAPNAETPPAMVDQDLNAWFFGAEYLRWYVKSDRLQQTLVTTSSTPNPVSSFGALGQTGTEILAGSGGFAAASALNGVRGTIGVAPECFCPIEIRAFWAKSTNLTRFSSDTNGLLARPIFDPRLQETAIVTSFPGVSTGAVEIHTETEYWGGEANFLTQQLVTDDDMPGWVADFHAGVKYMVLEEKLDISNRQTGAGVLFGNTVFGPASTIVRDHFQTTNNFAGGQVGARVNMQLWHFLLEMRSNVAVGMNYEIVNIYGRSELHTIGQPIMLLPGGIQAVASNGGRFRRNALVVIPETSVNLELPIHNFLRLWVGYDFTYWSQVVRPGSQVTRSLDTRLMPTSPTFDPTFTTTPGGTHFVTSDFWSHGINVGVALTF